MVAVTPPLLGVLGTSERELLGYVLEAVELSDMEFCSVVVHFAAIFLHRSVLLLAVEALSYR